MRVAAIFLTSIALAAAFALQAAAEKPVIAAASDVPVVTYELPAKPSQLVANDDLRADILSKFRIETERLMGAYAFADAAFERRMVEAVAKTAFMQGDGPAALAMVDRLRGPLANKPADPFMSLLLLRVSLERRSADGFETDLKDALSQMPFEVVRDAVRRRRAGLVFQSPAALESAVIETLDKRFVANGALTRDDMMELVDHCFSHEVELPRRQAAVSVLTEYFKANERPKADIWPARAAPGAGPGPTYPVIVAVWDDGTDVTPFPGQLWRNGDETANGRDDDGDGFIDNVHGIGFDIEWQRSPDLLRPLEGRLLQGAALQSMFIGVIDLAFMRTTEAAAQADVYIQSLGAGELGAFWEDIDLAGSYVHGTHVAGIMLKDNPAARLMVVRQTWDHRTKPALQLEDYFRRRAAGYRDIARFMSDAGVRVVNMSWSENAAVVENILSLHGVEADPEARRAMAARLFAIDRQGFLDAVNSAPEILFVAAAGNAASNSGFDGAYPSSIAAPNLIAVGAVDSAGAETPFTSYGETVRLHANGSEVVSALPGGGALAMSGTSMAAPQVSNLASRILSVRPDLSPPEVIAIMRATATSPDGGRLHLIHPAQALRAAMDTGAPGPSQIE
ncbi:MAG: S8 family serine peptidase [Pseudomonadota bacterium]